MLRRSPITCAAATPAPKTGLVAARAGVKKLVLSHLVPGGPHVTDAMWLAAVRTNFAGDVVIGTT